MVGPFHFQDSRRRGFHWAARVTFDTGPTVYETLGSGGSQQFRCRVGRLPPAGSYPAGPGSNPGSAPSFSTMWTTRTGITGYCTPYDAKGVTYLRGGRIRLTAGKTWSAGLMGPQITGPCRIEVETTGEYHKLHPSAVFAVWLYDDATRNELDLIEATRWGDRNQPNGYWLTNYRAGNLGVRTQFSGRAFNRHRIVAELGADGYASVRVYGWWGEQGWKEVGWMHCEYWPGQLRIALWTPAGISDALGDCSVVLDKCTVLAADAAQEIG